MKISIIIPIYNVEQEIERCLLSVIAQDYQNLELILVNDCTPDNSFTLAQSIMRGSAFSGEVQYIEHAKNGGLSVTRNTGIDASTGDYIFFLDSDDALSDDTALSTLMTYAVVDDATTEVVIGGHLRVGIHENIKRVGTPHIYKSNKEIYQAYSEREFNDYAWGKLIKKQFLIDNQLYFAPGLYFEDALWAFYLYRVANKIQVIDKVVCDYYEREGSITWTLTEKWVSDYNKVVVAMYEAYLQNKTYFPRQTIMVLEKRRRDSLRHIAAFKNNENHAFILTQFRILKNIKLPIFSRGLKYLEQNLILRLPISIVDRYFSWKWGERVYGANLPDI